MITLRALWRHPIKGHGRESLSHVTLPEGRTIPWDRRWAVAHEFADVDSSEWSECLNFSRGAKAPALMAIEARSDENTNLITLSHPERDDLTFNPDTEADAFLEWVRPLMPDGRAQSTQILRVPDRGMTDTDYPSISLINLASNAALGTALGQDLSPHRWRANLHLEGIEAWEETSWVGKTVELGTAQLVITEPIERCLATTASPETGLRDADTLGALKTLHGHQNFGVYATVSKTGMITTGDRLELM